jgi:polysaccharide deacetylase 2 family uncharacterized protein YibQ
MAERAEVPAATLFRLLDDEDQRATVITRFLGRAEFAAAQEGAVIVAGRTRPDTVTALFSWASATATRAWRSRRFRRCCSGWGKNKGR